MNVLIAGGSGLVGSHLTTFLASQGHTIRHLSRGKHAHMLAEVFEWDLYSKTIDQAALTDVDVVINLAGAGVADKLWTVARKQEILDSRINAVDCLYENLKHLEKQPKLIIQASAIGYYGNLNFDEISKETDQSGDTFLAEVCQKWEQSASKYDEMDSRVAIIRIGVVLTDRGGALPKMMQPIQWMVGAPLGAGQQMVNWIHIHDLCGMISHVINHNEVQGTFNAVASQPVTNSTLTKAIGEKIKRPIWLPNVPVFALKWILGEMAEIVLEGNVVSNEKIKTAGYDFLYENVNEALDELLSED